MREAASKARPRRSGSFRKPQRFVRLRMAAVLIAARLTWGAFNAPLFQRTGMLKFAPPPQVQVYREAVGSYYFYFRN